MRCIIIQPNVTTCNDELIFSDFHINIRYDDQPMTRDIRPINQKISSREIYELFQVSYKIEANLAKAEKFPPLLWTTEDIQKRPGDFFGIYRQEKLAACIQVVSKPKSEIWISSLVVHPEHFKKGLGSSLLDFVLSKYPQNQIFVETAAANSPAISLYKKFGFEIVHTYIAELNIKKVRMLLFR